MVNFMMYNYQHNQVDAVGYISSFTDFYFLQEVIVLITIDCHIYKDINHEVKCCSLQKAKTANTFLALLLSYVSSLILPLSIFPNLT